ncbi:MAG: GAF domain-containing protein [Tumebacillaceae bacterium]
MFTARRRIRVSIEVVIGLGLIITIFNTNTLLTLNPSPFFIVVLYGAWMAGTLIGVLTGAVASLLYLLLLTVNAFSLHVFWSYVIADPAHYLTPTFLLIAGFVFGEIRWSWEGRVRRLQEQAEISRREADEARDRMAQAETAIHELEGRVMGQTATMTRMYEIAKSLDVQSVEQILIELMGVLEDLLHVEQASIYRVEATGEYARMAVRVGEPIWESSARIAMHPSISQAVQEARLLTWSEIGERPAPMFMVPIFQQGQTYAVIVIHRLPIAKVSADTEQLLRVLANWAGDSLERATAYEHVVRVEETFAGTQVVRWAYFKKMCDVECQRFSTYQIPFTIFEMEMTTQLPEAEAAKRIYELAKTKIRVFDSLSWNPTEQKVAFLFPTLEREFAEGVAERILTHFRENGWHVVRTDLLFNQCVIAGESA